MNMLIDDSPNDIFGLTGETSHERVVVASDAETGLKAIIAVYSTARGPAFGGCRYWHYATDQDAYIDALRLSHGMAMKNALGGLPFGGGKAVLVANPTAKDREAMFKAFGRMVQSLGGEYLTADDVGTTVEDMLAVRSQTSFVSGISREDQTYGGNPSPYTAYGVFVGLSAAAKMAVGVPSVEGISVAVQGLGSVGWALCERLHDAGAKLIVADIDSSRAELAAQRFDATVAHPDNIALLEADVFAPCAMGGSITLDIARNCKFRIVAGGANNQLISPVAGDILHDRNIFYAPDFLINAGGIVSCAREYLGSATEEQVLNEVALIGPRLFEPWDRVRARQSSSARVVAEWARDLIVMA